jgi:hypothetical protein
VISFSRLSKKSKPAIEAITRQHAPYSDFNFTSLYCWNTDGSAEYAVIGDCLIVRMPDYTTGKKVLSILGGDEPGRVMNELLCESDELRFVPHATIDALPPTHRFQITEDHIHHDYIYDLKHLALLQGRSYATVRSKVNQFKSLHPSYTTEVFEMLTDALSTEIREVTNAWLRGQPEDDGDESESLAIDRFLAHANQFAFLGVGLRVEGELIGFSINEILDDGAYAICHLQKVIKTYKNSDALLTHYSSQVLYERGCKMINWEQDLGIAGLRKLKRSYRPVELLKKYKVSKAN